MDRGDKKKSSQTKRNISKSTDNKKKDVKKNQVKDKNQGKKDNVLEEIDEDIFNLSNDYSLAHCFAEDLRMGAGIAVDFKNIFGGVGKLVDQKLKIGDVGIVKRHDQYAFYLITKKTSTGKPTMMTMEMALNSLLNKMKEYNLTKLGIPKIGCGLDKLDWSETKSLISKIFSGSGIHITVCVPSKVTLELTKYQNEIASRNCTDYELNEQKKTLRSNEKYIEELSSNLRKKQVEINTLENDQVKMNTANQRIIKCLENELASLQESSMVVNAQREKLKRFNSMENELISLREEVAIYRNDVKQTEILENTVATLESKLNKHELIEKEAMQLRSSLAVSEDRLKTWIDVCREVCENVTETLCYPEYLRYYVDNLKNLLLVNEKEELQTRWKNKHKNNNGQKQSRFSDAACVLEEIDEDIFNLSNDYSLAHCFAEDLRMGAGIAVDFKNIFGGVGKLVDQKLKIGDVGIVKRHDQYAFYLITKKTSTGKPTMKTMKMALNSLLNKMKEYNLTKLGIPKIGCGLDKLDWSETKSLISKIFSGSGIHITVCVPSKLLDSKTLPSLKVYITPTHLWEMECETIIILFIDLEKICNKNWTDHVVNKVDAKYPFKENLLRDVKNKKPDPGDTISYKVKNEVIICMFTTENAYYGCLENGFKTIDHKIKGYKCLAIQSSPIDYPSDNFQHISWIVLILRSVICSSELWLCGDVQQKNYWVYYDEYCKNVLLMNDLFQYNSPNQKYNRYNDDRRSSFNTKETSNQH